MPTPTLERDVTELRRLVKHHTTEAATKRAAAEQLVQEEKAKGVNPLTGTSDGDREAFTRIKAAYKEADTESELASEFKDRLLTLLDSNSHEAREVSGGDPSHPAVVQARTLADVVTGSEEYVDLVKSGRYKTVGKGFSSDEIPAMSRRQTKQFLSTGQAPVFQANAGDGAPLIPIDQQLTPPVEFIRRELRVLDLITVMETESDMVTWTRSTIRTNNAGTKAMGSPLDKSRYQRERVHTPVIPKGHWTDADEGNLADQPLFESIINEDLIPDLRLLVEDHVIAGTGDGVSDWQGIMNTPNIGVVDLGDFDGPADALHAALTTVRIRLEREPNAFGIDPLDFQDYWLEKGTDGHYKHHRGPQDASIPAVWGKPAVVSTAFSKPIVGDWRKGTTLYVREGVNVQMDRIDDQFIERMWAIRATFRGALAHRQPFAYCIVEGFES